MYIRLGERTSGWENAYRLGEHIPGWENVYQDGRMYTMLGERIAGISDHINTPDELIPVWENVYQSVRICTYVCVFKYNIHGICKKYTRLGKHLYPISKTYLPGECTGIWR